MSETVIPKGYIIKLNLYDTQNAIALIKATFQEALAGVLNLKRVSAPLFVDPDMGLNDNLNGVERPVRFDAPATGKMRRSCILLQNGSVTRLKGMIFMKGAACIPT